MKLFKLAVLLSAFVFISTVAWAGNTPEYDAVGYDDEKKALLVRNSWGKQWGQDGYFWLPYEFVTQRNMSADYWTIRMVE